MSKESDQPWVLMLRFSTLVVGKRQLLTWNAIGLVKES